MRRRLLEAFFAVVLEESLRIFLPHLLPYAWLVILALLTIELLNAKWVKNISLTQYGRLSARWRLYSYVIAGLAGAGLLIFYWWGIEKTFAALEKEKQILEAGSSVPPKPAVNGANISGNTKPTENPALPAPTKPAKSRPYTGSTVAHVLPPKSDARFHERIDAYTFSLGENGMAVGGVTVDALKKGNKPFVGFPITVFSKDDDDKIHYRIQVWNGLRVMEIIDGEFSFNAPYGDRNYSDTALEVVDDHQKPLLQVIWKTPSHLVINGIFRMQNGQVVIADSEGWRPMLPGDSIKPIFKYPSYRFQGQYAD